MSRLLASRNLRATGEGAPLAIARVGPSTNPGFDRYLILDDRAAYHLGNVCNTCEFLFERLDHANRSINIESVAAALAEGPTAPDTPAASAFSALLPQGEYVAALLEISPRVVSLGSSDDYFASDQIKLWGLNGYWGIPHHPRVQYYRTAERDIQPGERLFEIVVPMFPPTWLDEDVRERYQAAILDGATPTAVSLSLLDIKAPAVWPPGPAPDPHTHWCLAHYLLDGHHKLAAAAALGRSIALLAFIAVDESIAKPSHVRQLLDLLAGPLAT